MFYDIPEIYSQLAIQAEQKRKIAPIGTSVTLRCKPGNPEARHTIRWFRENLPLSPSSEIYSDTLRITNVQRSDEGRYYCEISTRDGTFSDYVDLELTGNK